MAEDWFFLQDFWSIFKVLRIFAAFPFEKYLNEEGKELIRPLKNVYQIVAFMFWIILLSIPLVILSVILGMNDLFVESLSAEFNRFREVSYLH